MTEEVCRLDKDAEKTFLTLVQHESTEHLLCTARLERNAVTLQVTGLRGMQQFHGGSDQTTGRGNTGRGREGERERERETEGESELL